MTGKDLNNPLHPGDYMAGTPVIKSPSQQPFPRKGRWETGLKLSRRKESIDGFLRRPWPTASFPSYRKH